MNTPEDLPRIAQVEDELLALMRLTADKLVPAASFPAICGAPRVQSVARRSELALDNSHGIKRVLHRVLKEKRREEISSRAAGGDGPPAHSTAKPLAEPAKRLLGLTDDTANEGIMQRCRLAAPSRRVEPSTMINKHHQKVAHELASYLLIENGAYAEDMNRDHEPDVVDTVIDRVFQASDPDDMVAVLDSLSQDETRQLAVEIVTGYRSFYRALAYLYNAALVAPQLGADTQALADETLSCLHQMSIGPLHAMDALWYVPDFITEKEGTDHPTRYLWLASVLSAMRSALPRRGLTELDLLIGAAVDAGPSLPVFLDLLEQSTVGEKLLASWVELMGPRLGEEPVITEAHRHLLAGWSAAELLIHPDKLGSSTKDGIARFVSRFGSRGEMLTLEDAVWKAEGAAWKENPERPLTLIHDSEDDRAFLRECNQADDIDTLHVASTLRSLVSD